jgi:hypothetical protein
MSPEERREFKLRRTARIYGLTVEALEAMTGKDCPICLAPFGKMVVDHDHETGGVRGVICGNCNTGLGMFGDAPEALQRAADYLRT